MRSPRCRRPGCLKAAVNDAFCSRECAEIVYGTRERTERALEILRSYRSANIRSSRNRGRRKERRR
jgi:predicted nucleic acid-binding Zn ribbon protein